jgi:hypothetical protein
VDGDVCAAMEMPNANRIAGTNSKRRNDNLMHTS